MDKRLYVAWNNYIHHQFGCQVITDLFLLKFKKMSFSFFLTEAEQMAGDFLDFGVQRATLGSAVS